MTLIIDSYAEFENKLLVAAYYTSNRLDKDIVSLGQITEIYDLDLPTRFTVRALSDFWDRGLSLARPHLSGIETQLLGLTADGMHAAERLIGAKAVELRLRNTSSMHEEGIVALDEEQRTELLRHLAVTETRIDTAHLSNAEKAQARAYIFAIRALAEAPEPPRDLIWEIISRANNVAGIAALFVSIAGLFA